LTKGI